MCPRDPQKAAEFNPGFCRFPVNPAAAGETGMTDGVADPRACLDVKPVTALAENACRGDTTFSWTDKSSQFTDL